MDVARLRSFAVYNMGAYLQLVLTMGPTSIKSCLCRSLVTAELVCL